MPNLKSKTFNLKVLLQICPEIFYHGMNFMQLWLGNESCITYGSYLKIQFISIINNIFSSTMNFTLFLYSIQKALWLPIRWALWGPFGHVKVTTVKLTGQLHPVPRSRMVKIYFLFTHNNCIMFMATMNKYC